MTPQPRSSAMRDRVGWKAGTVFLVGITLLATASTRAADDRTYYMALRRPPWAPPPWAFGVAWPILNLLQVWSDLELVNKAPSSRRSRLLWLRALNWFCFVIYTPAFFRLRSPAAGSAVAVAQAAIAYATIAEAGGGSGRQRWSIVPLAAWTSYAAALSESVRRRNPEVEEFVPSLAPRRKPDTNRAATPRLRAASIDNKA